MANLRIISVSSINSTSISAVFSEPLNEDIGISNIQMDSQTPGVPTPSVLIVSVVGNTLNITTQPLTPLAAYFITFLSTTTQLFNSINGDAVILNDGITNRQLITGALDSNNPVQQYFINFFRDNVYNLESPSVISNYIKALSTVLSKSLYDIRQSGNENYLSFKVIDEIKTRGPGAFDRLNEEGAYDVLRVGKNKTGTNLNALTSILSFPNYPVSLQSTNNIDNLTINSIDKINTFNINTFTLNLSKNFAIILNSVVFIYAASSYIYNIQNFGYQILDSQYDKNFAFSYLQLKNNQIILSDKILNDPLFSLENIISIQVNYQYKDTGKIIDPTSLSIDTIIPSGREVIQPLENIFTLKHAPIVKNTDVLGSLGDIIFIDPNSYLGSLHPAFLYEIVFRLDYLPSKPGEYSVDYVSGNVYVFGATISRDGTGPYPPLASYSYRFTYKTEVDYVYDSDSLNLISLPNGSLINSQANIRYNYEEVLAQGIDYEANTHIEVLSEKIQNRLVALNAIQPLNFPITDVFRIFNETSGEIYPVLYWTDNKIYFNYIKSPNIINQLGEKALFQNILNEILFVSATTTVNSNNIFKIFMNNNNIIALSQDCIGSFINSSVNFSNTNIFIQERYFDLSLSESINNSKLQNIGDYQIDYVNGIIWCLVPLAQNFSIGTVSYKRGYIAPQFPHLITVDNIYYKSNVLSQITKTFTYINFSDGSILPSSFDVSNESFFMANSSLPYQILSGQVGEFINATFTPGLTNNIKYVRGLYEYQDLSNNINPINFASVSLANAMNVIVSPLQFIENHFVQYDGVNYYILANTNLFYKSPNITITVSIVRISDSAQLWNGSGVIITGSPFKLILPGINSPILGDAVILTYSYTIQDLSRIVVDYNKGDYFIDYSYLADEIIISYEYGDNVLDFRQSAALSIGDTYYATYKVGALRDGLLANFGTLINIPILNSLDVSFERERYRDALIAAMQSFPAGPTVSSMSNIVNTIVHTPPKIVESAFINWSLGNALLNPEQITTTGSFNLPSVKYGSGVSVNTYGQTIKFPVVSNLRLEQGSLETWVMPEWNGIDNESELTISILKNGIPISAENIFIGPGAYHPSLYGSSSNLDLDGYSVLDGYSFTIDIDDKVLGIPNEHKDGVFIYYAPDHSGSFNRWYMDILDGYSDGYTNKNYLIIITTNGKFYNVKSTLNTQPIQDNIFSGNNKITYTISGTTHVAQGITFIADNPHYLFDFGSANNQNRFSVFKDESGYINFKIIDKYKNVFIVSSDVSFWQSGQLHHVAASWAINTKNARDEMHLFIDGFEVPNIIKYKDNITPYLHEKFRTVDPEEIIGVINNAIVASTDLITVSGSNTVSSSINFTAYGILSGGTIYIEEPGFSSLGYSIINVNGQVLTLSVPMPLSSTGLSYSVNKTSFDVLTEIDIYPNIAISLLHVFASGTDLQTTSGLPTVSSVSSNFTSIGIKPGYIIRINEPNFNPTYIILAVNGNSLTLSDNAPTSFLTAPFYIYTGIEQEIPGVKALRPAYTVSRDILNDIVLSIRDQAKANDIVLIRTLGLNHKIIDKKYYLWNGIGNANPVNIIMTRLPPPIVLQDVKVTHIILDGYLVGPTNSTLTSGIFVSNNIYTDQPSLSDNGRTLNINITGTNVNYISPVSVVINGTVGGIANQTNTLSFTKNESLQTTSKFESINYITVSCKPINVNLNCVVVSIKELYPITVAENSITVPVIRYSYQMYAGNTLTGIGNTVNDINAFFSIENIGNYLVISSTSAVGQYQILDVSSDHKSMTISGNLPSFSGGLYQVLNITTSSGGLQNGFFTFELVADGYIGKPYNLVQGLYEFEYASYISIPITLDKLYGYIGSDINGHNTFKGAIDEFQIVSEKLKDTRIGETEIVNQETITKDFNSLKELKPTPNTLMLLYFNSFPFVNSANIYTTADKKFIQSSINVNDNFGKSICITDTPLVIDNAGILNSKNEGTIEFWVNPLYDTVNDPNYRFYFDATSAVSEKVISTNNATVNIFGRTNNVLNIKLKVGDQNIDYFAGGNIDLNMQTLHLKKPLPNQQTPVVVNYVPNGINGDRISIYKDPVGYINFYVRASGVDYTVRSPTFWTKGSWHRLKGMYRFNTGLGSDEIKFFIDGYERGNILFGNGLLYGQGQVFGSSFIGQSTINASLIFKDTINEIFIGSDFTGYNGAFALIDNLRISDISRPLFLPYGESIDVNYSSNINVVFPVAEDLYTTLLLNFDSLVALNDSFATLKNSKIGLFDFSITVFDSFGILSSNSIVKQVLESLINTLKPANSRAFIRYVE